MESIVACKMHTKMRDPPTRIPLISKDALFTLVLVGGAVFSVPCLPRATASTREGQAIFRPVPRASKAAQAQLGCFHAWTSPLRFSVGSALMDFPTLSWASRRS